MISIRQKKQRHRARVGSLLLEAVAGLAALGISLVLVSRATIAVDRQWQLTAQERIAVEALDNALEAATSWSWNEITADRLAELPIPGHARDLLYKAAFTGEVVEETSPISAKRLCLTLTWQPTPLAEPLKRNLTIWVYPSRGEQR